jgi:MFS family permease
MLRKFTDFILQGRVQAMSVAFILSYIPFLGTIGILIAGLVTLRKGFFDGMLVVGATSLPYLLNFAANPSVMQAWLVGLLLASYVLTGVFAFLLRHYGNWNVMLNVAIVIGIVVVGMVHVLVPDIQNQWVVMLNAYVNKSIEMMQQDIPKETFADAINIVKPYATGFVVMLLLLNTILQVVIARWWQAVIFNPGGLKKELYNIRLSYITGFMFVAGMVFSYLGNATALDIMPVFYGIYCAAGLSLLHKLVSSTRLAMLWLFVIYLAIILVFPLSVMVIAVLALVDVSVDFRKRLIR